MRGLGERRRRNGGSRGSCGALGQLALDLADEAIHRQDRCTLVEVGLGPALVVIRWKDIYESLEHAVDACETIARLLEGFSLKRGRA